MPLSFFCLAAGPRYISGPEVAMFYLLETVLAPVWMWMIFYETPTRNSLIGGVILIVALVAAFRLAIDRRPPAPGGNSGQISGLTGSLPYATASTPSSSGLSRGVCLHVGRGFGARGVAAVPIVVLLTDRLAMLEPRYRDEAFAGFMLRTEGEG